MEYAKKCNADLLLATDPDCDRVGIAVKNKAGEYEAAHRQLRSAFSYWTTFAASARSTEKCRKIR